MRQWRNSWIWRYPEPTNGKWICCSISFRWLISSVMTSHDSPLTRSCIDYMNVSLYSITIITWWVRITILLQSRFLTPWLRWHDSHRWLSVTGNPQITRLSSFVWNSRLLRFLDHMKIPRLSSSSTVEYLFSGCFIGSWRQLDIDSIIQVSRNWYFFFCVLILAPLPHHKMLWVLLVFLLPYIVVFLCIPQPPGNSAGSGQSRSPSSLFANWLRYFKWCKLIM